MGSCGVTRCHHPSGVPAIAASRFPTSYIYPSRLPIVPSHFHHFLTVPAAHLTPLSLLGGSLRVATRDGSRLSPRSGMLSRKAPWASIGVME
jgi:hypothetical protein